MLKKRLLTASILITIMVATLYYLPPLWFMVILGLFVTAAIWEWTNLAQITKIPLRIEYLISTGAIAVIALFLVLSKSPILPLLFLLAAVWWVYLLVELVRANADKSIVFSSKIGQLASGVLILVPALIAPVYLLLHERGGPTVVLFVFAIVWLADSAAYFVGRAWGKTKLAPQISPGKSIEGLLGGLVAVALLALIFAWQVWNLDLAQSGLLLLLVLVTGLFSVLGDLVESKFKRIAGVKDSGTFLPGHGGVLDRIDAFTAAAPVFTIGWILMLRI